MMLSRAAERVYWLGRYLERAEGTARIVQQYTQMLLDLPASSGVDWTELPKIFGETASIEPAPGQRVEHAVIERLVSRADSTSSLRFSIAAARDNLRNTRDLMPAEVWESINELHGYARRHLDAAATGDDRYEVLSECIGRCQQINGALTGTMSHRSPLHFLRLGQNLERADMTTRVIDVAANYLADSDPALQRFSSTLWSNTLRALSAYQMYRQYAQIAVTGPAVIRFLACDGAFPRAVRRSVDEAASSASRLPTSGTVIACLAEVSTALDAIDANAMDAAAVSASMDGLQRDIARVHTHIAETWFLRVAQ
jgi:uncharacterized alpha-E superfamily protein